MADITILIRADHDWFREQFAKLDDLRAQTPVSRSALERVWRPLGDQLDVHACIEEQTFYPQLLKRGADDPEGETLDAIGDHNDIRDGVRDANTAGIGTEEWWAAVSRTRSAFARHSAGSTTNLWLRIPPPRDCGSSTAIPSATSSRSKTLPGPSPRTIRWASAA